MNSTPKTLALHLKQVFFGGNWTCTNVKDTLSNVTLLEAQYYHENFNTIGVLSYHIHYFVKVASNVLANNVLEGNDQLSFDVPSFKTEKEWQTYLTAIWTDVEQFAELIETVKEEQLWQDFTDSKYGNYFRNIQGIIEHTHYHLGQIVILKKLIRVNLTQQPQ